MGTPARRLHGEIDGPGTPGMLRSIGPSQLMLAAAIAPISAAGHLLDQRTITGIVPMTKHPIAYALWAALLVALIAVEHATAQPQIGTFAGKTVNLIIGFGPGGGYDLWGRIVARHIGKHLPGTPNVVPQNMPGGGSFNAANHIYTIAPKDGTVMGLIARDAPLGPLTGAAGARFDPLKITWVGTPTNETNVCIAMNTDKVKVKTYQDLLQHELIIGNTGVGTGTYSYPKALNGILGTKFKLISGFPSSSDVFLAMERGEVDGICESLDSVVGKRPDWIATKRIN